LFLREQEEEIKKPKEVYWGWRDWRGTWRPGLRTPGTSGAQRLACGKGTGVGRGGGRRFFGRESSAKKPPGGLDFMARGCRGPRETRVPAPKKLQPALGKNRFGPGAQGLAGSKNLPGRPELARKLFQPPKRTKLCRKAGLPVDFVGLGARARQGKAREGGPIAFKFKRERPRPNQGLWRSVVFCGNTASFGQRANKRPFAKKFGGGGGPIFRGFLS